VLVARRSPEPPQPANAPGEERDIAGIAHALRGLTLDAIERIAVDDAIRVAGGSLPAAARLLGLSPSTLYRKRERWSADPVAHAAGRS
jgi:two-component system repressor protein LuxO